MGNGGSDIAVVAPLLYLRHEVDVTVVGEVEVECLPVVGDGGRKDADGGEILHVEGELIVVEGDGDDAVVVARYLRPVEDGIAFLRRGAVSILCCQGEFKLSGVDSLTLVEVESQRLLSLIGRHRLLISGHVIGIGGVFRRGNEMGRAAHSLDLVGRQEVEVGGCGGAVVRDVGELHLCHLDIRTSDIGEVQLHLRHHAYDLKVYLRGFLFHGDGLLVAHRDAVGEVIDGCLVTAHGKGLGVEAIGQRGSASRQS